jgi:hypothetical protein
MDGMMGRELAPKRGRGECCPLSLVFGVEDQRWLRRGEKHARIQVQFLTSPQNMNLSFFGTWQGERVLLKLQLHSGSIARNFGENIHEMTAIKSRCQ